MSNASRSLLDFLGAPVVVGDPDGRAVYLNPSFQASFRGCQGHSRDEPLANLFQGGAREAVLSAVARVCASGETVRFKLREEGEGFCAVASPIDTEQGSVGVMILLTPEGDAGERLFALQRDLQGPVDDLVQSLDELASLEEAASEGFRAAMAAALRALDALRKCTAAASR